jgi:DNA-binding response OmpR family regulator
MKGRTAGKGKAKGRKKVLLIEDDQNLLAMLSRMLAKEECEVLTASDGDTAIAVAEKEHPDLLLIDILIPKKNGIAVLRAIRATAWGEEVPAILLTNLSSIPVEENMRGLGRWRHVVKANVSIADIVRMTKETLAA